MLLTKSTCLLFIKSTCLLVATFLKFIFSQKEMRGILWSKTFDFLGVPWKWLFLNFKNIKKLLSILAKSLTNKHGHEQGFIKDFAFFFRNTFLKEHLSVAPSVYFSKEASQGSIIFIRKIRLPVEFKCDNSALQISSRGVLT